MNAIDALPEALFPLPTVEQVRSVFVRSSDYQRPEPFDVTLAPGERIVSVETVAPNPSIGCGTRVWIAR